MYKKNIVWTIQSRCNVTKAKRNDLNQKRALESTRSKLLPNERQQNSKWELFWCFAPKKKMFISK